MAATGSKSVVLAALAANMAIATAKFAAAGWTGSAAMLSEAIHSLADTANQGLLLHGVRRAGRPADAAHPFGYGKEIYFWAFVVAILLFSLGAGVAIYEGIAKLRDPHPVSDPWINFAVLGVAFVCEAGSTLVAWRELDRGRGSAGTVAALRSSKDPALFTVLLENIAAMAGLLVAFAGVACGHFLGWPLADALASIVIGIILGLVAALMAVETKALLIGEAAQPEIIAGIETLVRDEIRQGTVRTMHSIKTMHLGPDEIIAAATLDFRDGESARTVEATVARLERSIRQRYPAVRHLYLATQASDADAPPAAPSAMPVAASQPTAIAPRPAGSAPASGVGKSNHPPAGSRKGRKRRR